MLYGLLLLLLGLDWPLRHCRHHGRETGYPVRRSHRVTGSLLKA